MTIPWGPTGELVYNRTYSRTKPDGTKETWPETVERVVDGNLALAGKHLPNERERLIELMTEFKILPAGRHLWASGVKGRQYLFNCHVSGWGEKPSEHFSFTFLRLMEGGGVGANYSNRLLQKYPELKFPDYSGGHQVHIVCDPEHPDYGKLKEAGVLSDQYTPEWEGSFEVEDSREGWAGALVDLIDTYYRRAANTNRVFDVSRVRAEGARLKTFGGRASGPLPLAKMLREVADILNPRVGQRLDGIGAMEIDHAIAQCVVSGGNRRSARMAIMHWNDNQIGQFLKCKSDTGKHWTTNISVEVDDLFWNLLETPYEELLNESHECTQGQAFDVMSMIAEGMLTNGEPGFWNSSLSNVGEPNEVIATNPCGEIALESWENCNLGHVNLAAFVDGDGYTDDSGLEEAHRLITRFLIRATYGDVNDPKQASVLVRNRRIGVGHFGFASYLAKTGVKYAEAPGDQDVEGLLLWMAEEVELAARIYSHALRIPVPVKLRTVAPTGTIAKMPGVSEGIHPIFAKYFIRRIRFSTIDPDQRETALEYMANGYKVEDDQYAENTVVIEIPTKDTLLAEVEGIYGAEEADEIVQSAADLTLEEMLRVQALYQRVWADNAVSYTANVDPEKYSEEDVVRVIREIGPSLKGGTIFPEMSMPQSPYERLSKEEYEAAAAKQISDGVDEECAGNACPVR